MIKTSWVLLIIFLSIVSCSKQEKSFDDESISNLDDRKFFLKSDEQPELKLMPLNQQEMVLKITNVSNQVREVTLDNDPGEFPNINQYFYANQCNQHLLVVVLRQGVNTGVSHGYFYWNVLIDTKDGKLMRVFNEGEVKDKETGEIISNGQKQAIAQLMSGKQSEEMCTPI